MHFYVNDGIIKIQLYKKTKLKTKKVEDNSMKKTFFERWLGLILSLSAVGIGIYFGLYHCIFKSIVQIINGAKAGLAGLMELPFLFGMIKIIIGVPTTWYLVLILLCVGLDLMKGD